MTASATAPWYRRARPLVALGVAMIVVFAAGVRWGLAAPVRDVALLTYAEVGPDIDPAFAPVGAALYADGRFAVLTAHFGYRTAALDQTQVSQVFGDVDRLSAGWSDNYPSDRSDEKLIVLTVGLRDGTKHEVRVEAPDTNLEVPRSLRGLIAAIGRWQREVSVTGEDLSDLPLSLAAKPVAQPASEAPLYDLPSGFDITPFLAAGGSSLDSGDPVIATWDLGHALTWPANVRTVRAADGRFYEMAVLVNWVAEVRH